MNTTLPYPTRQIELNILGHAFKLLEVADAEILLDELIRQGEEQEGEIDDRIPYWAELWPSALGMAQFLIKQQLVVPDQKILELGCGLGLPGIVAGRLGAQVTLSDYLQPALDFAGNNWALNNEHKANLTVLDWRAPEPHLAADLLLASDITYEVKHFPFLPNAFHTLCKPGGKIVLSDPRRQVAQAFFENLPQKGFTLEKFTEAIEFHGRAMDIHIYLLSRS